MVPQKLRVFLLILDGKKCFITFKFMYMHVAFAAGMKEASF